MNIRRSETLLRNSLLKSHTAYQRLTESSNGETGNKNKFGDASLGADIILGNSVVDLLKRNKANVIIHSEESANAITLGEEDTVFLDDLDGSGVFRDSRDVGRYGTMMAIFEGQNPHYGDYLAVGVMEHSPTPRLFYAVKGEGAFVNDHYRTKPIRVSNSVNLRTDTIVHCDTYFEIDGILGDKIRSRGIPVLGLRAAETQYVDVAEGVNSNTGGEVVAGIDCTRKGNLELIAAYGLIIEAGGAIHTLSGEDLRDKSCLEFLQHPEDTSGTLYTKQADVERTPIITTANGNIFDEIQNILVA